MVSCNLLTETPTDLGCIPNDPAGFVSKFYAIGLGLIGGVSIIFIIYGGYVLLMSAGNKNEIEKGKGYITYAIVGLLLVIFAAVFINIIGRDILKIPGFS